MPQRLTLKQVKTMVLWFFASRGRFPAGTTKETWESVTMAAMEFDDPELAADPHFEKKKMSLELQAVFQSVAIAVDSPLDILKAKTKTMAELCTHLHGTQREVQVLP